MPDDAHDPVLLPSALARRNNEDLVDMARVFTAKPPMNKRGLVEFLVGMTCLPDLRQTLALAGEDGRAVLAHAAHGNGQLRSALRATPGFVLGGWRKEWLGRERPRQARKPSVVLLFFPDDRSMPADLRARVTALLPAPLQPPLEALTGVPPGECVAGDAEADLAVVLESAKAGQIQSTQTGPSATSLRRLAAGLGCAGRHADFDQLRLRCLIALLIAAGWLELTAKGVESRQRETDRKALQALFRAYREWRHDELHDLSALYGVRDEFAPISEPVARRAALLRVLARCPVGAWMDFTGFERHASAIEDLDPILEERGWVAIGRGYAGSMSALGDAGLTAVRQAWMRVVLGCHLAPLGIVEVSLDGLAALPPMDGYAAEKPDRISHADRVAAFRVTPLGAWLLGVGPEPAVSSARPGGWRIQADGSIVSLGERVAPAERVLLDRVAERSDERSWRLERSLLIAAIAAGDQTEELRARLTGLSGSALPDPVGRLLEDAGRRATAVQVEAELIMLRVDDPRAREQLLHDRATRALCRDCGGALVGVPPADFTALRRAARKLGWHIPEHHAS